MRWRRKRMNLAERLRPYVEQHRVLSEPVVDADPIRMFLFRWMIETGDPIEVVAEGFDVDPELLSGILDRTTRRLPTSLDAEVRKRLDIDEHREAARPLDLDFAGSYDAVLYSADRPES